MDYFVYPRCRARISRKNEANQYFIISGEHNHSEKTIIETKKRLQQEGVKEHFKKHDKHTKYCKNIVIDVNSLSKPVNDSKKLLEFKIAEQKAKERKEHLRITKM